MTRAGDASSSTSTTRAASLRQGQALLMLALLTTLLLWNVPYGQYLLYPFKLFATWLHESSHGLVMLVTGAGFDRMMIYRDTSGLAYPNHGVTATAQAAISSAGYVGTAAFGALFLVLGRTPRGARLVLRVLGAIMALSALVFVRNAFGVITVAVGAAALVALSFHVGEHAAALVLNFLAAQACINAVLDIRVLYGTTLMVNGQVSGSSDAHTMARVAGGAPALWATIWLAWSFLLFFLALRFIRVKSPAPE